MAVTRGVALPSPDHCVVMGILNVTTDSFSDGGQFLDVPAAVQHAHTMAQHGAHIIDIGGESTRPGATRVDPTLEQQRVTAVISQLRTQLVPPSDGGPLLSVDTMRSSVATAAIEAGAHMVNDVSGGLADPLMAQVVAQAGVPVVLMHWTAGKNFSHDQHSFTASEHEITQIVCRDLAARAEEMISAGVDRSKIVLDPGLGFAKTAQENWQLIGDLPRLHDLGYPLLLGASRKRFIKELLSQDHAETPPLARLDDATASFNALSAMMGAWGVRVHDVPKTVSACSVAQRWPAH